jgi:hypothetical protein
MLRLILGVVPCIALGAYILLCAVYGCTKGEMGSLKSPALVTRKQNPVSFIALVIWTAIFGTAFIVLGFYWLVNALLVGH